MFESVIWNLNSKILVYLIDRGILMLTTKQKAYLRSLGQTLEPAVRIGKLGVTDDVITSVEVALKANDLIKVRTLSKTSPQEPQEVLEELAEKTKSEFVQKIGHNGLLYKPNPEKKKQIELPK